MGADSCLGPAVICYNVAKVKIRERAIVSQRSHLCTASHDFNDPSFPLTGASIVIASNAWVAAEVFIGPGVQIGSGAVIVARSVVVRDVAEGAIMGGNPAKIIGERNWKIIS